MTGPKAKPKRKMPSQKSAAKQAATTAGNGRPKKPVVEAPKPKRNIPVVGIAFGIIAVLLVAAVTLTGNTGSSEFGEPVIDGEFLPFFPQAGADPAVGVKAPKISGEDFGGEAVTFGDSGTPTAVVFLAHWCPHCQAEVPEVQRWLNETG